jgi:transposase-like protein
LASERHLRAVKLRCPQSRCSCSPAGNPFTRHGSFFRSSDSRTIYRWRCKNCKKTISRATGHPCFKQHKRRINSPLYQLLCSGVSLRRSARLLRVNRITIVRKFRFLAEQSRAAHAEFLTQFKHSKLDEIIFDEMESFEHTKFKPLSILLAVTPKRQILFSEVAQMPAKGLLAAKSRKKYGYRKDDRPRALRAMFAKLEKFARPDALFKSDQNPSYPFYLRNSFPHARHETTKGGRSAIVGQGELKKLGWDPIFSLNHTAAMFRANMNRLFRKTWCTTKTVRGLRDHLALYTRYHNENLLFA